MNFLADLLGTQALDEDNNSYVAVGFDVENQIVYLVDSDGDTHTADFTELRFPEMKTRVKPAPLQAVESEEEVEEEAPRKGFWG